MNVDGDDTPRNGVEGVAIALWRPKCEFNVANVVRAAACFGVDDVRLYAPRYVPATGAKGDRKPRPLRMKAYADVRLQHRATARELLEGDYVPVAVEMCEVAQALPAFAHPRRALYLFGPEDGSLEDARFRRCQHVVSVPTRHCLNLAMAVNIVLYDRLCKNL